MPISIMLIVVINSYAQRIESVDMAVVKDSRNSTAMIDMLDRLNLVRFEAMYSSLETLFKQLRPAKQPMFSTPPQQTTVPVNPNFSGGSSSSTESKAELYAQNVISRFIDATCASIKKWLVEIEWANPEAKLYLSSQYVYKFIILTVVLM
jgi:hypothetical protein